MTVVKAMSLLSRLAGVIGCMDTTELFQLHMLDVLRSMKDTYQSWTQHSAERLVFDALLLEAGQTFCSPPPLH